MVCLLCGSVVAGNPPELITDRPDATESSSVVPRGMFQVETGWTHAEDDENSSRVEVDQLPGTLVRIGLGGRTELRLGWAGHLSGDVDGSADTDLGFKLHLAEERGRRPEIALLASTSLPTGDDRLSSGRLDPAFRLSLSHTLSSRWSLGYNLGPAWGTEEDAGGERDTLSSLEYTAALGIGVTDRLGAFVEVFGEIPLSAGGGAPNTLDGGFTFLIRPNVQLDVAGGFGLSDSAGNNFAGVGVSFRLPH